MFNRSFRYNNLKYCNVLNFIMTKNVCVKKNLAVVNLEQFEYQRWSVNVVLICTLICSKQYPRRYLYLRLWDPLWRSKTFDFFWRIRAKSYRVIIQMRPSLEVCLWGAALLSVFNRIKMGILHEFWSGCHRPS